MPPLAPIGEGVSTAADVGNIAMDVYRSNPEQAKSMAKQAVKGVAESLVPDPIGDLQQGLVNARSMLQKLQRIGSRFIPTSQ